VDLVLGQPVTFGLGYALADPIGFTTGKVCHWQGGGGSIVINDLDNHVTMAYVMNRMQPVNETRTALLAGLRSILD